MIKMEFFKSINFLLATTELWASIKYINSGMRISVDDPPIF